MFISLDLTSYESHQSIVSSSFCEILSYIHVDALMCGMLAEVETGI